jgi:hypothetical protein
MKRLFWLLVMVGAAFSLLMCGGESPSDSADGSVALPDASQTFDAATAGEDAAIAHDDAGSNDLDASTSDSDAQLPDAEVPDAGDPDAEVPDASAPDAEVPDASAPDAGPAADAGPVVLSCSAMVTCFNGCGSDEACLQTCFDQGDPEGQTLMTALMDCFATNCSTSQSSSCVVEHCSAEVSACVQDI